MVLAIETSGAVGSVALTEGEVVLGSTSFDTRQEAVRRLAPAVAELLQGRGGTAALSGLAVSSGPGSFNGLRAGVALAKAMAHALGRPVVGVPTPQVWAAESLARYPGWAVAVVQPARRGYVFLTLCQSEVKAGDQIASVWGAEVVSIAELRGALEEAAPAGMAALALTGDWPDLDSWTADQQGLVCDRGRGLSPSAATVAALGRSRLWQVEDDSYYSLRPAYGSVSQAERNWGVNLGL